MVMHDDADWEIALWEPQAYSRAPLLTYKISLSSAASVKVYPKKLQIWREEWMQAKR